MDTRDIDETASLSIKRAYTKPSYSSEYDGLWKIEYIINKEFSISQNRNNRIMYPHTHDYFNSNKLLVDVFYTIEMTNQCYQELIPLPNGEYSAKNKVNPGYLY